MTYFPKLRRELAAELGIDPDRLEFRRRKGYHWSLRVQGPMGSMDVLRLRHLANDKTPAHVLIFVEVV